VKPLDRDALRARLLAWPSARAPASSVLTSGAWRPRREKRTPRWPASARPAGSWCQTPCSASTRTRK
jgi:hypothetical protein